MAMNTSSHPHPSISWKGQAIPWTQQETVNLIQAYQEKWYGVERGQMKSKQWEEVAMAVASRCGYTHFHPSKTFLQCRHKMEKLRQRFRSEKNRLPIGTLSSPWIYFQLMNNLLQPPSLPISAHKSHHHYASDSDEADKNPTKSKSITNILRRPIAAFDHGSSSRNSNEEEDDEEEEEMKIRVSRFAADDGSANSSMCSKLAVEIGVFADRLIGMESLKMEMMKEVEMNRIAMEKQRIQMILESENKIVNSIAKAFGSHHHLPKKKKMKMKIGHDS